MAVRICVKYSTMNKNSVIAVSLFGFFMFACSIAVAEDSIKADEDLSEFKIALKLAPDIDNGQELYKLYLQFLCLLLMYQQ